MANTILNTRLKVVRELEQAYADLERGTDWDLSDREYWQVRLRILETTLKATDDSDVAKQITALEGRINALAKPQGSVTPIRAKRTA